MIYDPLQPSPIPPPSHAFDAAIATALAEAPFLTIRRDFARDVARLASGDSPHPRARWVGWGPRLALGSGALLTLGLFALAPHAAPSLSNPRFDAELVLLAELSGLLLFTHRLLHRD